MCSIRAVYIGVKPNIYTSHSTSHKYDTHFFWCLAASGQTNWTGYDDDEKNNDRQRDASGVRRTRDLWARLGGKANAYVPTSVLIRQAGYVLNVRRTSMTVVVQRRKSRRERATENDENS